MTHVFLATPCYGGLVTHHYLHSVLALTRQADRGDIAVTVETLAGDSLIPRARNTLVAKFLAHRAATHLLFVDADIGFTPAQVAGLLALNEEVAACLYPLKQLAWDDAAVARARGGELISTAPLRYVGVALPAGEREQRGRFVTAAYAGTGLMLIARGALVRMMAAYPGLRYTAAHATLDTPSEYLAALFDTAIDAGTGHYTSEDYTFCARWRAIGGKIWLDTQSCLTHTGSMDFIGNPAQRLAN